MRIDRWILVVTLILLGYSLLMVASASMVISDRQYGDPFHYVVHQCAYILAGIGIAVFATQIRVEVWQNISSVMLLASLVLLVAVLVPGIGKVVNGSRRWINLGLISLQVSEVVKFCFLMYLASYLDRFRDYIQNDIVAFIKPMAILGVIGVLLLMQPDFGAAIVIALTALALLFIAGVRLWPFTFIFGTVTTAMFVLAITSPYRLQRLTTFINPWAHAFGSGYQLTQSLIAFGRGGLFGVGLGNSVQKLFYLPEAHTDFLFAVVAEELGLFGELFLIGLFVTLVVCTFILAKRCMNQDKLFAGYYAYGTGIWIALQAMINIGVNAGFLPTKGLTLPFLSYGGSSMLINCLVVGILFRIAMETPE